MPKTFNDLNVEEAFRRFPRGMADLAMALQDDSDEAEQYVGLNHKETIFQAYANPEVGLRLGTGILTGRLCHWYGEDVSTAQVFDVDEGWQPL